MIARIRKNFEQKDQGFTLIELLVVMIIIGILAAVAIPLFLSQREKAEDTAAKADVDTLATEISTWFVDSTTAPYVGQSNGEYLIGADSGSAEKVANSSPNVVFGSDGTDGFVFVSRTDWCVYVTNPEGDATETGWRHDSNEGSGPGGCS